MNELYNHPEYYEIAFSFRDIPAEVDLFERCFAMYSKTQVKSVLELGAGNSPHAEELVKRGYYYNGLEINQPMIDYSLKKAEKQNIDINLIQADMTNFSLKEKVDFAYTPLGSLFVKNDKELTSHFDSVAQSLYEGGLYLLDWCIEFSIKEGEETTWTTEEGNITVTTTVFWKPISLARQIFEENIILKVNDNGKQIEVSDKNIRRAVYPQEFRLFIDNFRKFEFIGWWNNWDLDQPLDDAGVISRPIIVLRRI